MLVRILALAAALCAAAAVQAAPSVPNAALFTQQQTASDDLIISDVAAMKMAGMRLLEFGENERRWVPESAIPALIDSSSSFARGFMDVTEHPELGEDLVSSFVAEDEVALPTAPTKQNIVDPMLAMCLGSNLKDTTVYLSSFTNRYYSTANGVNSANGLLKIFNDMIVKYNRAGDASVRLFKHSFQQPSVIATITGRDATVGSEIIALGAHLDSYSSGNAPGADDDASGVANIVEIFRVLLESGFKPKRTIEFMAFAAEEVGLKGSVDIAAQYVKEKKNILTMYNCEMSGYTSKRGKDRTVTVLRDYVDTAATDFLLRIVDSYCDLSYKEEKCGYACSDQASFQKAGFKTVCAAEAGPKGELNPYYHSAKDTVDKLDFEYSLEFTKMALAFAVELSEF